MEGYNNLIKEVSKFYDTIEKISTNKGKEMSIGKMSTKKTKYEFKIASEQEIINKLAI